MMEPVRVMHAQNFSSQEARTGGSQVQGGLGLHNKTLSKKQKAKQTNKNRKKNQTIDSVKPYSKNLKCISEQNISIQDSVAITF